MSTLKNLWSIFFGFMPAWFQAFLIAAMALVALLVLFWLLKLIWDSIPFV